MLSATAGTPPGTTVITTALTAASSVTALSRQANNPCASMSPKLVYHAAAAEPAMGPTAKNPIPLRTGAKTRDAASIVPPSTCGTDMRGRFRICQPDAPQSIITQARQCGTNSSHRYIWPPLHSIPIVTQPQKSTTKVVRNDCQSD